LTASGMRPEMRHNIKVLFHAHVDAKAGFGDDVARLHVIAVGAGRIRDNDKFNAMRATAPSGTEGCPT